MRLVPLVLLALIALVAPSRAHAQTLEPPGQALKGLGFSFGTSARPTALPDDIVARVMAFDRNHDGKVEKAELAERMYTVMERGDRNGDGSLDRSELLSLATAKPAPDPVRGFGHGSYAIGANTEASARLHLEGALDDLRLEAPRKVPAQAIIASVSDTLDAKAKAELLDVMKAIVSPAQLGILTKALEQDGRASVERVVRSADNVTNVFRVFSRTTERSVAAFGLLPEANGRAMAALQQYRSRLRPSATDRAELGRQLASVLTPEETEDFLAAIARQPVAAASGFVMMGQVSGSHVIAEQLRVVKR